MKKSVSSSHLAIRFYKSQGWTKELLEEYLISGEIIDHPEGQEPRDYWFGSRKGKLDLDRLYHEQISEVQRYPFCDDTRPDLEYLKWIEG